MITQKRLKELLHYDPETGIFTNKVTRTNSKKGQQCGFLSGKPGQKGLMVCLDGKTYYLARLAFLYMTGNIPPVVDHKDRNRLNNSWNNLRAATMQQNAFNRTSYKSTTTGIKGIDISYKRGIPRYRARVGVNGKRKTKEFSFRMYPSQEEALEAAKEWLTTTRKLLHKEFTCHE